MAMVTRKKGTLQLSSHDINILSVIAQQTSLPHEFLREYAKQERISAFAEEVLDSLLSSTVQRANVAKKPSLAKKPRTSRKLSDLAADDFQNWAADLKV